MNDASNVVAFAKRKKALNARSALAYLAKVAEGHPESVIEVESITHLGTLLGWERPRTSKQLKAWETSGQVTVDRAGTGKLVVRILPGRDDFERAGTPSQSTRAKRAGGTRAKRAGKRAVDRAEERADDRANVENIDDGSEAYTDHLNAAGTQNMGETAPENVPAGTRAGTPPARVPRTLSRRLFGHANRDVVHRAEDPKWHAVGRAREEEDDDLHNRRGRYVIAFAYLTAITLAGIAAWFSVRGMVAIYPGDPEWARVLGIGLEVGKIATAALLAAFWGRIGRLIRTTLLLLVFGCEILNATGVFGQLVIAHVHKGAVAEANFERTNAQASGQIDIAQNSLADLNRRIATIDDLIAGAARNGNPRQAARVKQEQEPKRAQLVRERDQVQRDLAAAKLSKANSNAQHKVDEAEAAPVIWAARTLGFTGDSEVIVSKMIALTVLCLDPLAVLLLAAVHILNSRRSRRAS
jgi:hypothetical protein